MTDLTIDVGTQEVMVRPAQTNLVLSAETPGVTIGIPGPAGPPGGAILTGWWQYSSTATPPPGAGQLRTEGTGITPVGQTATGWLSHTDDDGLAWPEGLVNVGDLLHVRDTTADSWQVELTAVDNTVPGPAGYSTFTGLVISTSGALVKNKRVQVNLIRRVSGAPILTAPGGSRWRLTVTDAGILATEQVS